MLVMASQQCKYTYATGWTLKMVKMVVSHKYVQFLCFMYQLKTNLNFKNV